MGLPKELTTVTTLSKTIALIMFISMPIIAFIFGLNYQMALSDIRLQQTIPTVSQKACTEEARICPDGSAVGRGGKNCEFDPCPTSVSSGETSCGGIRGSKCQSGYVCNMQGKTYPDASGICVKTEDSVSNYKCPNTDYVDCMPGTSNQKTECTSSFLQWAKNNCPSFKGVAY